MCWSALPEHLDSPAEWDGKDDDKLGWWGKFRKRFKGYFAYGPRDKHWYHRWREKPVTLFAWFGKGESRWENDLFALRSTNNPVIWYWPAKNGFYLSRIQYWCDWHIQIQWPLFFAFHFKYGKKGLIYFYIGAKRDADRVYWFPAFHPGTGWK